MNLRYLSICGGLCSTEMSCRAGDMFHQESQRSTKPLITGCKSGSSKLWRYKGVVILYFHLLEWSKNDFFFLLLVNLKSCLVHLNAKRTWCSRGPQGCFLRTPHHVCSFPFCLGHVLLLPPASPGFHEVPRGWRTC